MMIAMVSSTLLFLLLFLCLHRASMAVSKPTPRYYTPGVGQPLHPSTSVEVELEYANCEASES